MRPSCEDARRTSMFESHKKSQLPGSVLQCLANRQQEDRALALRVRRKKFDHFVIKKRQAARTQPLRVRRQIHPAPNRARLQLHCTVAAVPVRLQDAIQIGQKENGHASVRRQLLLESKAACLSAKSSGLQRLQRLPFPLKEVSPRCQPLHRMNNQVNVIELLSRPKKVSPKSSRRAVENGGELCRRNRRRRIERSRRSAPQDYLLD